MTSQVVQLPRRAPRRRPRPIKAVTPATGRAWINGREVGGTELRFAHLALGSD